MGWSNYWIDFALLNYFSYYSYLFVEKGVGIYSPTFLMKFRRRKCIPSCASHQGVDEDEVYWDRKKQDKESAWSHNSAHVISQLAQCFTNAMFGPRSWIGGLFSRANHRRSGSTQFLDYTLTPIQEERLQRLKERLGVPYDETRNEHQEALQALWDATFPGVKLKGMISEQWKDMGWQGANPATDFRGCGFLSLENLLYFARNYPVAFSRVRLKQSGERSEWEYPFAVAGINVSFMLTQMLDLHSEMPKCLPGFNFVRLLGKDKDAFDVLYCIAFSMMDAQWLAMQASYMQFNRCTVQISGPCPV
ncbi:ELMO domain-containing protein A-like isoform X2 [Salvia hispanica]|uniref:ELMO domain-containing protein A-like isoform X2 n=1 Tax=Salvia hispanica TaxID=49212 RepID=UPI00200943A2|nr:ELMO domain-containing protein A-like isoform X2 [Salvia hispanica]